MAKGNDTSEPCIKCGSQVWISQVTMTYSTAERMFWFVAGECKECQKVS